MTNNSQNNYNELKQLALQEGMALFGVGDVRGEKHNFHIPAAAVEKLDNGISIGFRLSNAVLTSIDNAPNQLYYFHYQRANLLIDQTLLKITAWIQDKGFEALPVAASQVTDWEKQRGSVSHREIARLAGLGWYGRNNLMVNEKFGSHVRYATVLTDIPLTLDSPVKGFARHHTSCGACRACVDACPAQAISETGFDLTKCHEKLKGFMKTEKIGQMICGVCVKVCK